MESISSATVAIVAKSSRGRTHKRKISQEQNDNPERVKEWERKNHRLMRLETDNENDSPRNCSTPIQCDDATQMMIEGSLLYECGKIPYSRALKREKSFLRNTKASKCGIGCDLKECINGPSSKHSSNMDDDTRKLVNLTFNDQIFINQISRMYLDIRLRSLKKMDRARVLMANMALCAIEKAIEEEKDNDVMYDLSKSFYSIIKHDFGWLTPPVINSKAMICHKKKVLMTLTDILTAQSLKGLSEKETKDTHVTVGDLYKSLNCKLTHLKRSSKEFKIVMRYANAPSGSQNNLYKLMNVWSVASQADKRFDYNHKEISYRKLLWRATGAANVAATLREGLNMPTYSGKLGKGLYFNSNFLKALSNAEIDPIVREDGAKVGFVFLSEVSLGRRKAFKNVQPWLTSPPAGFDSVIGRGLTEPNPKQNTVLSLDGNDVIVPVGTPVPQKKFRMSKFKHSKYVVYKRSQAKLRYLLKFHIYQ